ncbi:MAG: hypothetical protein ACPIB1_04955, partial [Porticoccaceae bacterium]
AITRRQTMQLSGLDQTWDSNSLGVKTSLFERRKLYLKLLAANSKKTTLSMLWRDRLATLFSQQFFLVFLK